MKKELTFLPVIEHSNSKKDIEVTVIHEDGARKTQFVCKSWQHCLLFVAQIVTLKEPTF